MSTKKAKKPEVRKCPVCGKKFTPAVNNQKYCSKACKNKAKAKGKKPALTEKIKLPKGKKVVAGKPESIKYRTGLGIIGKHDPFIILAAAMSVVMDMLCEINGNGMMVRAGK